MATTDERTERIRVLRDKIAEIKRRLPKHTPTVAIMVDLDDAEYELRRLLAEEEENRPEQDSHLIV